MKKERGMIRAENIRKLLLTFALTAFAAGHAFAAGTMASPRAEVVLSGNIITVGDVFEGVTHDADHALAPAPANGSTMILSTGDLARISNAFNLGWYPSGGETVSIRRDVHDIDRYQIEAALQERLKDELGGQKFDLELNDRKLALHVPAEDSAPLEITNLKYDLSRGEFQAVAAAGKTRKDVIGRLYALTEVPVLNKALRAGDIISADDLQFVDIRSRDIPVSMVVSANNLIGQTPRRGIPAMRPVSSSDIILPSAVKKGEIVTMTLQNSIVQLTAQGRAIQGGSVGDVIKVANTSSNQVIEGVITGLRTIAIRPPTDALDNVTADASAAGDKS